MPPSKRWKTNLNREKWPQTSHWLLKIRKIVDKFDFCIPKVFPLIYCCCIIKMERFSCLITIYEKKKLIHQSFAPGNETKKNKNKNLCRILCVRICMFCTVDFIIRLCQQDGRVLTHMQTSHTHTRTRSHIHICLGMDFSFNPTHFNKWKIHS